MHTYLRRALRISLLAGGLTIVGSAGAHAVTDGPPLVLEAAHGASVNGVAGVSAATESGTDDVTFEMCDSGSAGSSTVDGEETDDDGGLVSSVVDAVQSTSEATGVDVLDVSSNQEENTADQSVHDPCATPMSSASVPHESATQSADEDDDATNSDASSATAGSEEPSQEGRADDSGAPSGEVSTTVEATDDNDSEPVTDTTANSGGTDDSEAGSSSTDECCSVEEVTDEEAAGSDGANGSDGSDGSDG